MADAILPYPMPQPDLTTGIGPRQSTWALRQIGSYLGHTGHRINVVFTPALAMTQKNGRTASSSVAVGRVLVMKEWRGVCTFTVSCQK
jgi:hypothetical protein